MFGMFSFAFWVIRALKCVVVNFVKSESAGIPVRLFEYLDVPIFVIIAHAPCTRTRDVHAHHDVTRFAYDANHVTMMSPAFGFHLCHIERRWHDIIGNTMTSWFTLHGDDVGMTSSCSHRIHIVLMMSSHLDCDVIATHMNHSCSHGA